ncbi:MAG TPA: hypothetical protein VN627_07230 [Novosphingobium sp.]|nr:hypothetical protein [Novosphingobium sp.]
MAKAKAHPNQLALDLSVPRPATGVAALAGLEARICSTVGVLLASDGRPREIIAAEMSVLLDETVSRAMLDAYSSPARIDHRVPMNRFWALVAVTGRLDLLDPLVREIGGAVLIGDEVKTARLGQLQQIMARAQAEMRQLKAEAPDMSRMGGKQG